EVSIRDITVVSELRSFQPRVFMEEGNKGFLFYQSRKKADQLREEDNVANKDPQEANIDKLTMGIEREDDEQVGEVKGMVETYFSRKHDNSQLVGLFITTINKEPKDESLMHEPREEREIMEHESQEESSDFGTPPLGQQGHDEEYGKLGAYLRRIVARFMKVANTSLRSKEVECNQLKTKLGSLKVEHEQLIDKMRKFEKGHEKSDQVKKNANMKSFKNKRSLYTKEDCSPSEVSDNNVSDDDDCVNQIVNEVLFIAREAGCSKEEEFMLNEDISADSDEEEAEVNLEAEWMSALEESKLQRRKNQQLRSVVKDYEGQINLFEERLSNNTKEYEEIIEQVEIVTASLKDKEEECSKYE
ncbi:hypothetical protein KI387_030068, partial [Taxus chinensis]